MADPAAKDTWFSGYWDVILPVLEKRFDHGKKFIAGTTKPTIADFKAFSTHIAWDSTLNSGCGVDAGVQQELMAKIQQYPRVAAWRQECVSCMQNGVSKRAPTPF